MERLIEARKRLVFDEFFLFIMDMQYQKRKENQTGKPICDGTSGVRGRSDSEASV